MGDNMDRDVWETFFSLDTLEDEFDLEAVQGSILLHVPSAIALER